jgi:enamine deaminase RidA (YjgF/YER057c/UK114 family)
LLWSNVSADERLVLKRVSRVVLLGVYLAARPEFTDPPNVANAASELLRNLFGDETVSPHLVLGVASVPLGWSVELEASLEVKP